MYVAVNGVRLFFDVIGPKLRLTPHGLDEAPTLVCLHGGPGADHMRLRPEIDRLAERMQVVLFDQRGGGRSGRGGPETWTLDQWADDTAALCGALGIEDPVVLGYSAGCMIALRYAARHPGHARALVLAGPPIRFDREALAAGFERRGGPAAGAAARATFERFAPEDVAAFAQHCWPLYARRPVPDEAVRMARSRSSPEVNRHFFGPGGEAWRTDLAPDAAQVACPTLVISGVDDPIAPAEMGREIAAAVKDGRGKLVLFDASSHAVMTDEPDRFAATVAGFVAAL